jgi:hypothetical protein
MMRTYSHIRRKALDEAAAALEPSFRLKFPRDPRGLKPALHVDSVKHAVHVTVGRSEEGDPRKR